VDFDHSPKDRFNQDVKEGSETSGTEVTYHEYYKTKYGAEIRDLNQPVLININQRTGAKIVLIPSLCQMTGLSESMRANF
jgi:hypothetical protein